MSKSEEYRKRAAQLEKELEGKLTDDGRTRLSKKREALHDLAEIQDWLDGHPNANKSKAQ